ncbi:MAG: PepSY domain-containing protein, partial [Halieaceae bacterium]|nr:PepSY domain-containing protein [Halieaceae bacterium]
MRQVFLGLLMLMSQAVLAGADCAEYAESERMSVLDLQKKIVNEYGFAIKKFKVDDNCYEIYGWESSTLNFLMAKPYSLTISPSKNLR